jgi:hypothetical protein
VLVWSCPGAMADNPTMTELLSAAEAARILGVSRGRVIELATSDPGFPTSQPSPAGGRAWPRVAVQAWAAAHPDRGPLHRGPQRPRGRRAIRGGLEGGQPGR